MTFKSLSPAQAARLLTDNPSLVVLDVREQWEYDIAHLPHARLLPLSRLTKEASTLEKDREYLVYCHHGSRSMRAAMYLSSLGFVSVMNLGGGINAYAREVDNSLKLY